MIFTPARLRNLAGLAGLILLSTVSALAQTNYYAPNGTEYAVVGSLPGDQIYPDTALTAAGGLVVWQDNATDGSSWGISARRLDSTLSGAQSTFRVNVQGTNSQENPRVAMLKNGGAAFVWQGGRQGFQHVFARFLNASNTWLTSTDLVVSAFANSNSFQINPVVTVLNNSNVVVVWASMNQAGSNSMQDVYAKILSPSGVTISNEFRINQFTNFNQRTPAVTALKNGGFAVAWVSEQQRILSPSLGTNSAFQTASGMVSPSVDIFARLYSSNGAAASSEFLVNPGSSPAATPGLAARSDGGFVAAWSARDLAVVTNGWDIFARPFSSTGVGGSAVRVNSRVYGDQISPRISGIGQEFLVVWTSLGQDGSREGVFGQFVHGDSALIGGEFQVNTTTISQQMQPAVASDGNGQFQVVWTSFNGLPNGFDLFAQRYADVAALLAPMSAPFVYAPFTLSNGVYQPQLQVTWPPLLGISVSNFQVYADGVLTATVPAASNQWTMRAAQGLTASSTRSFTVSYFTTDGRQSPVSPATSGTTWGGLSWDGIPYEWMTAYYGSNVHQWPVADSKLAGTSTTLTQVFLSGGNPLDPNTWLRSSLARTAQGMFLNWNTQPGATYQVQSTTNFTTWSNLGSPRFAAGSNDSIFVGAGSASYYRVYLIR